jgi:hypothetical protein
MIMMMNLENAERCDLYRCVCIVVGVLNVPSYFEMIMKMSPVTRVLTYSLSTTHKSHIR